MPGTAPARHDAASHAPSIAPRPACRSVVTGKLRGDHGRHAGSGGTARTTAHLRDGLAYANGFPRALLEVLVPLAVGRSTPRSNLTDP